MPRLTTRDYKRSSRSSGAAKLREFGLGVLVGAVLASAAFLVAGAHARHRAAASARAHAGAGSRAAAAPAAPDAGALNGSTTKTDAAASASATAAKAPQYDFYRMLPRLDVPVPHDDERSPRVSTPAAAPRARAAASGPSYILQVGSYLSSAEADRVRARLARAGLDAQVDRIVEGSRTWHRVRIGPLSGAPLARARAQLQTADIRTLSIRVGP